MYTMNNTVSSTVVATSLALMACEEKDGPQCPPPSAACDESTDRDLRCAACDELWECGVANDVYTWQYTYLTCDCQLPDGGFDSACNPGY